jgi:CheY-like chemotaxis protein
MTAQLPAADRRDAAPGAETAVSSLVLVVDDSRVNRLLLHAILESDGFRVIEASDGAQGLAAWREHQPDLVFMDINMPVLDGYEATRRIKAEADTRFVPIIFVTAATDEDSLAECVRAGGDDFISHPVSPVILLARARALLRTRELYNALDAERRELAYYREMMEREQAVAKTLFESVARNEALGAPNIRYVLSPMSMFNGDVLFSSRTPAGDLHILMGDFTGHGLAASIGALPASDIFYAMAAKGFDLPAIAAEINARLVRLLPTGMFCAVCGVTVAADQSRLGVLNAGFPDLLLRRAHSDEVVPVRSRSLPLGIVESQALELAVEWLPLGAGDRFLVFSDGVPETQDPSGRLFGLEAVVDLVHRTRSAAPVFDDLLGALESFRAGHSQRDDLTLLEYAVGIRPV